MSTAMCAPAASTWSVGRLGLFQLQRYWEKSLLTVQRRLDPASVAGEYELDFTLLHGLGLGIVEPANYLFGKQPSFAEFEAWICAQRQGPPTPALVGRLNAMVERYCREPKRDFPLPDAAISDPVLSAADLQCWDEHGYVVLREAVPAADCQAVADLLWQNLGMDPEDPESWYRGDHLFWVSLFQHPALTRTRCAPRIHKAFAQLWGCEDLWATVDRCSVNRPERDGVDMSGPSRLHWDVSLAQPMPLGIQGLLYLTDTSAEQGAFRCVPGFHRRLPEWLATLPAGAQPREQDLESLGAVPVPGAAGDFVIWHHALPHGSSRNRAERPRLVQYIQLFPHDYPVHPQWC